MKDLIQKVRVADDLTLVKISENKFTLTVNNFIIDYDNGKRGKIIFELNFFNEHSFIAGQVGIDRDVPELVMNESILTDIDFCLDACTKCIKLLFFYKSKISTLKCVEECFAKGIKFGERIKSIKIN